MNCFLFSFIVTCADIFSLSCLSISSFHVQYYHLVLLFIINISKRLFYFFHHYLFYLFVSFVVFYYFNSFFLLVWCKFFSVMIVPYFQNLMLFSRHIYPSFLLLLSFVFLSYFLCNFRIFCSYFRNYLLIMFQTSPSFFFLHLLLLYSSLILMLSCEFYFPLLDEGVPFSGGGLLFRFSVIFL